MTLANGQNYEGPWQAGQPAGGSAPVVPEAEAAPAEPAAPGGNTNGSSG